MSVLRCAWAVKAAGMECSVEILLQQLLWLDLGHQKIRIFHDVKPCSNVANSLDNWGCAGT